MDIIGWINKLDIKNPGVRNTVFKIAGAMFFLSLTVGLIVGFATRRIPHLLTVPYMETPEKTRLTPFRARPERIEIDFIFRDFIDRQKKSDDVYFRELPPQKGNLVDAVPRLKKTDLVEKYARKIKNP